MGLVALLINLRHEKKTTNKNQRVQEKKICQLYTTAIATREL